jgi:two-component system, sporulation sensor kinase A
MIKGNFSTDFQQIVEHSPNGVLIVGENMNIHYANQQCLSLFKCTTPQLLNRNLLQLVDFKDQWVSELNLLQESRKPTQSILQFKSFIGEYITAEVKMVPYYSQNTSYICLYINELSNCHLVKMSSIQQLSAGIVHEVRNPLTAVKGFLHLLKEESDHNYLSTMEVELNKALGTLNHLLHIAKPQLQDEPFTSINLCQELDSIAYLFQEKLYSIKFEKHYRDQDVMVLGKRNSLMKAFFNLYKNAIEAIQDHGEIIIEQYVEDEMFHIKITDNGDGITKENLSMIGSPFFSTKNGGTGLGLPQVYTTIQNHNGNITVQSEIGKGTTFHICLPL